MVSVPVHVWFSLSAPNQVVFIVVDFHDIRVCIAGMPLRNK